SKKNTSDGDSKVLWSALLFILGILISAFTIITGESLWKDVHDVLLGAFGVGVIFVPVVLIAASVMIATDTEKNAIIGKVLQGILLIFLLCGAVQIFSAKEIDRAHAVSKMINDLIEDGRHFKGGGLFSCIFGIPLLIAFGKIGATVMIVLASFFAVLLLSNRTIVDVFRFFRNIIRKMDEARPEYRAVEDYIPQNPSKRELRKKQREAKLTPPIQSQNYEAEIPLPSYARAEQPAVPEKKKRRGLFAKAEKVPEYRGNAPEPQIMNSDVPEEILRKTRKSFDIDIRIPGAVSPDKDQSIPHDFTESPEELSVNETQLEVDRYQQEMKERSQRRKFSINDYPLLMNDSPADDKAPTVKDEPATVVQNSVPKADTAAIKQSSDEDEYITDKDLESLYGPDDTKTHQTSPEPSPKASDTPVQEKHTSLSDIIKKAATATISTPKPFVREEHPDPFTPKNPVIDHFQSDMHRTAKSSSLASSKISDDEDLDLPETTARDIQNEIAQNEKETVEYIIPPIELLKPSSNELNTVEAEKEMQENAVILLQTLESFGIAAEIVNINRGPSVTRYELLPKAGIKLSKIRTLADDIAMRLAAMGGIRIEAPIPGKAAVGIEVPNRIKDVVALRDVLDSEEFRNNKSKLTFAVGKNIDGQIILGDIKDLPHIIIAGTTGSGKSVCTNGIIMSLLYNATPEEVRLVLIDPKMVEFKIYNGIPHLLLPVVTDPRKAAGALSWAVQEMLKRYKLFSDNSVRNLYDYNELAQTRDDLDTIPRIVIVIDELADLMMAAKSEVEDSICRLAQMARAAGMHLIIATQRPTVDVVTGLIKSNIPSRIALRVASGVDSRTILDEVGAEKLLGNGDMLYFPTGYAKPLRVQNSYTSSKEVAAVVDFIKNGAGNVVYDENIIKAVEDNIPQMKGEKTAPAPENNKTYEGSDADVLERAIECAVDAGAAGVSVTYFQRKLKLGYARAARIMDELNDMGIVGSPVSGKNRDVLMTPEQYMEYKLSHQEDRVAE
ncbi:MAG: hypothetical protein II936_08130, partial [Oscillospiraceae bacterium]|nr:hypothetical protein [Oscillospiraceae bacterium]